MLWWWWADMIVMIMIFEDDVWLWCSFDGIVLITSPALCVGRVLFGQVVDHIDSLLEEWFPGLLTTDVRALERHCLRNGLCTASVMTKLPEDPAGRSTLQHQCRSLSILLTFRNTAPLMITLCIKMVQNLWCTDWLLVCKMVCWWTQRTQLYSALSQISPDLVLSDQPSSTILDPEQLEMELSMEYRLG